MAHLGPHHYSEDSEAIVEPASDVFEIDDFTSPSDWEKVEIYFSSVQNCNSSIKCYENSHLFY